MKNANKIISFFIAVVIISATILSINSTPVSAAYRTSKYWDRSTWAYYNQFSNWWNLGKQKNGNPKTSGQNGCGIVAFSIAAAILYNNKKITPRSVAKVAYKKHYWDLEGDTPRDLVMRLASYGQLKYSKLTRVCKKGDCPIAKALISQKAILVVRASGSRPFTAGGHYVAVVGADSKGYLKVVDPGHSDYRPKKMYYKTFLNAMSSSNFTIYAIRRK